MPVSYVSKFMRAAAPTAAETPSNQLQPPFHNKCSYFPKKLVILKYADQPTTAIAARGLPKYREHHP